MVVKVSNGRMMAMCRLEAKKRNLRNLEPEASIGKIMEECEDRILHLGKYCSRNC